MAHVQSLYPVLAELTKEATLTHKLNIAFSIAHLNMSLALTDMKLVSYSMTYTQIYTKEENKNLI